MADNSSRSLGQAWRKRFLSFAAVVIGLAALWCAGRVCAGILSNGTLSIPFPIFSSSGGGESLNGGTVSMAVSVGQGAITPMSGGTLELFTGVIAAQPAAKSDLSLAHAFPNPFKPSLGHTHIIFRGLTSNARIRVYTIAGELVNTLTKNDPTTNDLNWDPVANSSGQALASGVYLYTIEGDSDKKVGKLMVIK